MAERARRATIIGGSIAGLFLARLLVRRGWDVQVFERVKGDLRTRGAGIATHPELFAALREAGIDTDAGLGIPVIGRRVFASDGAILSDVRWPQIMAHWSAIYVLLLEALESAIITPGADFTGFSQERGSVTAHFADGSQRISDVLVGADGFRSTVRGLLHPGLTPVYSGNIAWRGVTPENRVSAQTRERLYDYFGFCLPPGEQMAGYPVRETAADGKPQRSYNFIWYRPVPVGMLSDFLTDVTGRRHDVNVPPPLVRPDIVAAMRRDARQRLNPEFVDVVENTEPFYQPIFDLFSPALVNGRVALIGDAAFVARPHVGAGVTKAFDDALSLARHLEQGDIDRALTRFDAERSEIGRRIVERSRELGRVMNGAELAGEQRAAEMLNGSATLEFLKQ